MWQLTCSACIFNCVASKWKRELKVLSACVILLSKKLTWVWIHGVNWKNLDLWNCESYVTLDVLVFYLNWVIKCLRLHMFSIVSIIDMIIWIKLAKRETVGNMLQLCEVKVCGYVIQSYFVKALCWGVKSLIDLK